MQASPGRPAASSPRLLDICSPLEPGPSLSSTIGSLACGHFQFACTISSGMLIHARFRKCVNCPFPEVAPISSARCSEHVRLTEHTVYDLYVALPGRIRRGRSARPSPPPRVSTLERALELIGGSGRTAGRYRYASAARAFISLLSRRGEALRALCAALWERDGAGPVSQGVRRPLVCSFGVK